MTKILLTTTSYQDTPGAHHDLLESQGYEIQRERGPLPEETMLDLVGDFDGILCGDDAFTRPVLQKCLPKLKVLSKYGIGLDKIDVPAATDLGIPVTFCPGVNHTTVAEHAFGLMLSLYRQIPEQNTMVHQGLWKRMTGHELMGKTLGILGLGRIGKEVAKRAAAFEMKLVGFDPYWDEEFASKYGVERKSQAEDVLKVADIVGLHLNLSEKNLHFLNRDRLAMLQPGSVVINTSRGGLVDQEAMAEAIKSGHLGGYGADVVEPEPIRPDNPLIGLDRVVLTPHIGSRTYESVGRQAMMATKNLIQVLNGEAAVAQANQV
ncbi:MAG: phosphoglycerate dehydrogenase [Candidatus Omnitrophica bacterium]|nr:phosphoglycerate dehydrogenase [Candidatus Omnitrophota bacterium]MCA9423485.1 phosphoglycerate dehydrogenase [Candidatus Omnitrophota bacterium]MCA9435376.1 phosphoglycerate dehydrogenase [Candidatus Omnitrophota bacterium]MCA9446114.1 phosphoglycerate dehydrogenase [Candidatus Omnitrophota bacterium]MCB9767759.1 phosphoglycerate dehydrogenase [Candidatus Omnitrophota bacterium]